MFPEIAHYWTWNLEKFKWLGMFCEMLGLGMFLSLWWHQDRGWRVIRWVLASYLLVLATGRFVVWIFYGMFTRALTDALLPFMIRSGTVGALLCFVGIVILILDAFRPKIYFPHFSPEIWSGSKQLPVQWAGLVIAFLALWWPFAPHPAHLYGTLFTWGFPTSFGLTLTPTILFTGGLFLAGSRHPHPGPLVSTGMGVMISSMVVDPITLHGVIAAMVGAWWVVLAMIQNWGHQPGSKVS
jgi:hypothetical protein